MEEWIYYLVSPFIVAWLVFNSARHCAANQDNIALT